MGVMKPSGSQANGAIIVDLVDSEHHPDKKLYAGRSAAVPMVAKATMPVPVVLGKRTRAISTLGLCPGASVPVKS
jgi:hypothetical protein